MPNPRPPRIHVVPNCIFCHWHASNFRYDLGSWDECEHPAWAEWFDEEDERQEERGYRIIDVLMDEPPPGWCPMPEGEG